MKNKLAFKTLGEQTLLIEWPDKVNGTTLHEITQKQLALEESQIPGIVEIWPAYRSLAISFDDDILSHETLIKKIKSLQASNTKSRPARTWAIPVCYEKIFGLDIEKLAKQINLSPQEIIQKHTSAEYTVHFMGFLPGFMYLGGLDPSLQVARKTKPDGKIPKGAVAIGGSQTGIYPRESPGGWHLIGNTPMNLFHPTINEPCFVKPGDKVRFKAISYQDYKVIQLESQLDVFDLQSIGTDG